MKNRFRNLRKLIKSCGVFALCFVMLFALAGASAEGGASTRSEYTRVEDILEFGEMEYSGLPEQGITSLTNGDKITFKITVSERFESAVEKDYLFSTDQMTLRLPETGLTYEIKKPNSETLSFKIMDGTTGISKEVTAAVTIENGLLTVDWDENAEGYSLLADARDVYFELEVEGTVNNESDVIKLDGNQEYYVDNTAMLGFTKTFTASNPDDDKNDSGLSTLINEKIANLTPEQKQDFKFTATFYQANENNEGLIRDEDGHIIFEKKEVVFTLGDNNVQYNQDNGTYSIIWENLMPRPTETVTIKETAHAELAGFTYNTSNQDTATVSPDAWGPSAYNVVTLTNDYIQDQGTLKLEKYLLGETLIWKNINNDQKAQIKYRLHGTTLAGDAYAYPPDKNGTAQYANFGSAESAEYGVITIPNIPVGHYTLTELATIDGYNWVSAMYQIGNAQGYTEFGDAPYTTEQTIPGHEIKIEDGEETTVKLSNRYVKRQGDISLTKAFEGSALSPEQQENVTFYMKQGNKYVWFMDRTAFYQYEGMTDSADEPPAAGAICKFNPWLYPGEKFQALNLPEGEYVVYETNADFGGYTRTTTVQIGNGKPTPVRNNSFSLSVEDDKTTAATITNTYADKGSLKVKKTIKGRENDRLTKEEKQNITFTLQRFNVDTGKYEAVMDSDENPITITYEEMSNGTKTWENLPYGKYQVIETIEGVNGNYTVSTKYTVKDYDEKEDGSYQLGAESNEADGLDATGVQVQNPYAGATDKENQNVSPAVVSFTNTYTPITTSMKITKTLGDTYPLDDKKQELVNKLKFVVKDSSGNALKWTKDENGKYVLSANGSITEILYNEMTNANGEAVLTGLPVGKTYTVTEINSTVSGYDRVTTVTTVTNGDATTSSPAANTDPAASATLVKDQTAQVSFHNEYRPIAKLTVTKKFAGDLPDAYCRENILPYLSFKITTSEGGTTKYVKDTNGTLTDKEGEAKAFSYNELTNVTLPGDKTYTITEYNRDLNGTLDDDYTITTWHTVTDNNNTSSGSSEAEYDTDRRVELAPGDNKTIEFTNQYRNKTEGIVPGTVGWVHNFKTWKGLDGGGCNGDEGNTVKEEVRFDLYRTEADGSGEYLYLTYTLQDLVGTAENGGKALVLPEGNYRLVERDADFPGYQRVTTVTILSGDQMDTDPDQLITANGVSFEVEKGERISITLANVYYPLGDLKITKTISQDGDLKNLTDAQKEQVSFTLTNTETNETKDPVTLKSFTDDSYTFNNLPVGYFEKKGNDWVLVPYPYKIKESNSIAYYDCETTVSISSGSGTPDNQKAEGTIQMTRPGGTGAYSAEMAFENKYVRQVGSLEISKAFSPDDLSPESKKGVTFKVLDADNQPICWTTTGHVYTTQTGTGTKDTFTYDDMEDGKFTITGLPTSETVNHTTQTYTVVESNADIESYSRTTSFTVKIGNDPATEGSGLNASVRIEEGVTSSVAFTNTYSAVGSLQVKKTFEMQKGAELPESVKNNVTFTVTLNGETKGPDEKVKGEDGVYTYTFNNLPLGIYTVKELNADRPGFTRTTTMTVGDNSVTSMKAPEAGSTAVNDDGTPSITAEVTHNQIAQVNVVNSYTESGKIWIRKSMEDIKLKDGEASKIVFAIRNEQGELLKAGKDYVRDEKGNEIGTITYGQLSEGPVLEGLPAGKYTVEEIILGKCNDITDAGSLFYGYVFTSTACVVTVHDSSDTELGRETYTHGDTLAGMKTNEYRVGADGVIFDFTNNYTQVNPLYVDKFAQNYPTTDIKDADGTTVLPVWEFTVTVDHLSADSAENGVTVLRDVFDGNLFKLCEKENFKPRITGGKLVSYDAGTSGQVLYTICANEIPQQIKLVYYLQVKDRTALAALLDSEPTKTTETVGKDKYDTAKWTFNNTIYYKPLPTSAREESITASYYYAMAPISKEIIVTENSAEVTFKLNVNPDGMHIGTENTLTILDKVSSNVIIDKSSFSVNPASCNINVDDYTESDEYDLVITVPNGVSMVITYKGRIVPSGVGDSEDVTNTATMNGMTTRVEREVQTASEGEGGGSTYVVFLYKYGTGFAEPLQGAEFMLYEGEEKTPVGQYTTNADGKVVVSRLNMANNAGLAAYHLYRMEEVKAPTGFTITDGKPIYFTLVTSLAEKESGEYRSPVLNGATLEAKNSPLETEVQLFAKKQLSGMPLSENQFSIGLYNEKGEPQQDAKQNDAEGNVTFDEIKYSYSDFRQVDANGNVSYATTLTRTYTIKEIVPSGATTIKAPDSDAVIGYKKDGILYDITKYTAEVKIDLVIGEDDTQQLVPTVTYKKNGQALADNEIPTFRNQYSAEAAVTLAGTKELMNAEEIQTAFNFEVALDNAKANIESPNSESSTVAIPYPAIRFVIDPTLADENAGVAVSENAIVVTANSFAGFAEFANGTAAAGYTYGFEFKVREIPNGEDSRFVWDETEHTFTVSIRDNGKGAIETAINGDDTQNLDFENAYYGSVQIKKHVTVGGKKTNGTLADGTYTFAAYTDANCSTLATTYGTETHAVTSITIENGESTTGYILGLEPGTYYVKETNAGTGMVLVGENPVQIEISENTESSVPSVEFTNNRPCSLKVAKRVTGTDFRDVEFTFEITMAEAAGESFGCQYAGNNETRPESVTFDVDGKCTVQLRGDESVTIMELPYDAAYSIKELTPPAGYTAMTDPVDDRIDTPEKSHTFTNSYAASGSVTLNAKKLLQGDYNGEEEFTFELTGQNASGENNVLRSIDGNVASQDVAIDGTANWTIDFTSGGTYTYTIQEIAPNDKTPGMAYDESVHNVTVVMTDHGDGTITPAVTYDGEEVRALDITNTYQRPKGTAVINATKVMTGNPYPYEKLPAEDGNDENGGGENEGDVDGNEDKVLNEFIFKLTPVSHPQTDTNNVFEEDKAQTVGVGETASWNLKFDMIGTYTYTLEELMGTEPGVLYDQTKYTVTIKVDYADDRMSLVTTVTYDDEADQEQPETADGVVFTNQYSKIVYQPKIKKHVTGESNMLEEIFTFTLTDDQLPPDCYTDTAECMANSNVVGIAEFKPITYYEPGTYTYYIAENVPEKKTRGMNYSSEKIELTVVVEKDENGALSLTDSYTEDGIFTNVYKPSEVYDFKVSFTKKWEGTPGLGIDWTLYDSDGNVVHKKFNKYVISNNEWYYEAWFNSDKGYYLIENVPFGYIATYENIGVHENEHDRCYNGGTIINYKIPETGEQSDMAFWLALLSISMGGLTVYAVRKNRNRRAHRSSNVQ